VIEEEINPSIASHGGATRLVSIDDDNVVYLELMGGCQGCGMASVTLQQGIERILKERVPEVTAIKDATDHAGGENPFYEAAKK
jgi:Fe/S biogenesis protein NfuA